MAEYGRRSMPNSSPFQAWKMVAELNRRQKAGLDNQAKERQLETDLRGGGDGMQPIRVVAVYQQVRRSYTPTKEQ